MAPSGQSFSADSADSAENDCPLIRNPWSPRPNWTQTGELAVSNERLDDDFIKILLGVRLPATQHRNCSRHFVALTYIAGT
ncbi:MAG: hypothetical protein CMJ70_15000 [Planctomycetaceae bacterium]|nr:hypothetical protein [Planctomycetaceae bacterium]